MSRLRLSGLVSAMNRVREQWQYGVSAAEAPPFRQHIQAIIAETEQACRERRVLPSKLPTPSYRAYLYLKSLDLATLPLRADSAPPPARPVRVRNLLAFCDG